MTQSHPLLDSESFASTERMLAWIEDLSALGHRKTGTAEGRISAEYIARHFHGFGLDPVRIEAVPTPCPVVHEHRLTVAGRPVRTSWANATGRSTETGRFRTDLVDAPIVYVGRGTEADLAGLDLAGTIVVCDVEFLPWSPDDLLAAHPRAEVFDAQESFRTKRRKFDIYSPNSWPDNYFRAQLADAAGFVGVLVDYMDSDNYNEDYTENGLAFGATAMSVPGLWVSRQDGEEIKRAIGAAGAAATASMVLDVSYEIKDALNVVGVLPGQEEDYVLVHSHHDAVFAGAVQDASGISEVLALAEFFAAQPLAARPMTMMFAATDTHFTNYTGHLAFLEARSAERGRPVVDLCVEHIAKEIELDDHNRPIETGDIEPRSIYVSDSSGLLDVVRDAVVRHGLDRTVLLPVDSTPRDAGEPYEFRADEIVSDAYYFAEAGIPVVSLISGPMYLFHPSDTPDRVAVDELRPVGRAFVDIANAAAHRMSAHAVSVS